MQRIVLVRHGKSSHPPPGWLDRRGMEAWLREYDHAGLAEVQAIPSELRALAARTGIVVSSDMRRATESATLLANGRPSRSSPLLRELDLPIPDVGGRRLPMAGWALVIGARWFWQSRRADPGPPEQVRERERARAAVGWLAELAAEHGPVFAVTHGAFRRYLADTLLRDGWTEGNVARRFRPWSAWEFTRGA